MWGKGAAIPHDDAATFEAQVVAPYTAICDGLSALGLNKKGGIHVKPEAMQWQVEDNSLTLSFELPSGCFATSVIREIILPLVRVTMKLLLSNDEASVLKGYAACINT